MQGEAGAKSAAVQAQNAVYAAQSARINAYATDNYYRNDLRTTLANISAMRASVGMGDSPTSQAVTDYDTDISNLQRSTKVTGQLAQAKLDTNAASYYQDAASDYLMTGFLGAGAGIVKGLGQSPGFVNWVKSW
jgi:uncharacterized protein YycO